MQKRAFIVHRWDGNPNSDWYPWLSKELKKKGFLVKILKMPNTSKPKINVWVSCLRKQIKNIDKNTYLIGHSIGCQTILRYLQSLNNKIKVGNIILVAPWMKLNLRLIKEEGVYDIAEPWLKNKINWNKVNNHLAKCIVIFSSSDPYVTKENYKIFKNKLKTKIIIEKNKGHFTSDDGVKKLPIILKYLK